MGGKIWSSQEERYFWRTVMSTSTKRSGISRIKDEKSWVILARDMQHTLGAAARRHYTGNMLFEHYYQNIRTKKVSPHAGRYVCEYLIKAGSNRDHPMLRHCAPRKQPTPANNNDTYKREESFSGSRLAMDGVSTLLKSSNYSSLSIRTRSMSAFLKSQQSLNEDSLENE
ncbi:hypothetical protein BKA67DRAFT_660880 [Truncatella angustata]|uniref:Uncharacterized protein n=1 Tax=Truncatella angustata TaxID=152316 RepID=A0A9P8ZVK7_9PEZI|nr:uncharacterized protein BKA67DRAFT_660880 [Truncatella angustata]KAH6652110.1 hypothetical protein BKA67DRAFT_660880 [Truncatella angustata]KAH8205024.1 hypothetical protein TruAng_000747 [Truncatella angustata]